MSPTETTVFDIPAIGDDLSVKDGCGEARYTMARIKRAVEACSNPPQFRGAKTPITGLLDPEDKSKREPHAHGKDKKDKLQSRQNTARDPRPAHEKQANFPPDLKRPDPTSTVEGRKSRTMPNGSCSTISRQIAVRVYTRRTITAQNARCPVPNGKKSLTERKLNIGNRF
jgi:hypothetical protein